MAIVGVDAGRFAFGSSSALGDGTSHRFGLLSVLLQLGRFFVGQGAPGTGGQIAKDDGAFTHANQAQYFVTEGFGDAANLALAPFVQHDAQPGAGIGLLEDRHPGWCRGDGGFTGDDVAFFVVIVVIATFVFQRRQGDTLAPFPQIVCGRGGVEQGVVFFFDLVAGVGECLCYRSIIGQEHQPFAGKVQTANKV